MLFIAFVARLYLIPGIFTFDTGILKLLETFFDNRAH